MSIELEDAKTKVAQFQKQCEEYLVVIVQQKRDADDQQKVRKVFSFESSPEAWKLYASDLVGSVTTKVSITMF